MVRGTLRVVLWILGGAATLWLRLWTMRRGGAMSGRGMGNGRMGERMIASETVAMGMMAAQWLAMLGLIAIFLYLVVDAVRERGRRRDARMDGRPPWGLR